MDSRDISRPIANTSACSRQSPICRFCSGVLWCRKADAVAVGRGLFARRLPVPDGPFQSVLYVISAMWLTAASAALRKNCEMGQDWRRGVTVTVISPMLAAVCSYCRASNCCGMRIAPNWHRRIGDRNGEFAHAGNFHRSQCCWHFRSAVSRRALDISQSYFYAGILLVRRSRLTGLADRRRRRLSAFLIVPVRRTLGPISPFYWAMVRCRDFPACGRPTTPCSSRRWGWRFWPGPALTR